jgi:arylsulfatase A
MKLLQTTFLLLLALSTQAAEQPNVILIMADDLGYGDLSCYGSQLQKTPVLDQLAKDGIRLTSFYAGATVCTPSRMALLTGAYPVRCGWRGGVVGYGIKTFNGLAPEAVTIAEVFQKAGYRTGLFGKWHLGDSKELLPMHQGFEETYYINKSNNQTKQLWRGEEIESERFDNSRLTENFIKEAIDFVKANKDRPFFAYLPLSAPHFPADAHPDWKGKSANEAYGDVVEEMDHRIGDLLHTLRKEKLEKNTIVVFTSDNGPEPGQRKWATAAPYQGLKWSALEGGTRVPCIVRWPGKIPSGQVSDALTAAIDILPTLAHACGIQLDCSSEGSPKVDGVNIWDSLIGVRDRPHQRSELIYWQGWAIPQAIRVGDWKLYVDVMKAIPETNKGPALFLLSKDPGEKNNLADKHPEKVKEMMASLEKQLTEIEANRIQLGGRPINKPPTKKRGKWLE